MIKAVWLVNVILLSLIRIGVGVGLIWSVAMYAGKYNPHVTRLVGKHFQT